jgi:hypothetical protein
MSYNSGVPDISGLSNYKPTSNGNFHGNTHSPSLNFETDGSLPLTLSVFAMANGTTEYTVKNGNNSQSFWYDTGASIESGYFYIFNHAGYDDEYVYDLQIGSTPPGYVADEPESESLSNGWSIFGDTSNNRDGSYRLNGNPGAVNDFVRTDEECTRPCFGSATFDAGWNQYYPLIEFVDDEGLTRGIYDIGGYFNYKPETYGMKFGGNDRPTPSYSWTLNETAPLTLSVFADSNGNVTYTVTNGHNSESWTYEDDSIQKGYFYVSNRAGSSD